MIPWIQVYANLPGHRKTCKLRDSLNLKSNYEAVGLLVCLWSWAAVNAVDGNLSEYSARDIADATGYKKAPAKFLEAMVQAGFLDSGEDGTLGIHDWMEHAALLMDSNEQQKKNTRERVKRYRERKKNGDVTPSCNVTCNESNAPTLPNLTLPNLTVPYLTNNLTAADGDIAGAGVSSEREKLVREYADWLFQTYFPTMKPNVVDYEKVKSYDVSEDRMKLLGYAFMKTVSSGKGKDWRYIDGIMERLSLRGIETLSQAILWDSIRQDLTGENQIDEEG
jgi:hypothetical protein